MIYHTESLDRKNERHEQKRKEKEMQQQTDAIIFMASLLTALSIIILPMVAL